MISLNMAAGLSGRSVVVTGAAGGIGSCVVKALAGAGVAVLAVDLPGQPISDLPGVQSVSANLMDLSCHAELMEQAASLAPLAGLVHTAAVIRRIGVDDVTEADFDLQMNTNLKTTFFLNREAWRHMRTCGGAIVNFVSQAWMTGGFQGSVVYSATKGGVTTMTKGLARSFAADKVRVNAVSPGFVDTDMMRQGITDEDRDRLSGEVPLGRLATADELVGAAVFLLSDAASYITGSVVNVSGGHLMY